MFKMYFSTVIAHRPSDFHPFVKEFDCNSLPYVATTMKEILLEPDDPVCHPSLR